MVPVAGIRIGVRVGDVVTFAGTGRVAGTEAAAETARAAGYVRGAFARVRGVRCA